MAYLGEESKSSQAKAKKKVKGDKKSGMIYVPLINTESFKNQIR